MLQRFRRWLFWHQEIRATEKFDKDMPCSYDLTADLMRTTDSFEVIMPFKLRFLSKVADVSHAQSHT